MAIEIQSEVVRLALLAGDEAAIRDTNFTDCDVHGAAIIYLGNDTRMAHCKWDGDPDAVFWEIAPDRQSIVGAIHLERVSFVGCRFTAVGIAVPRADMAKVKAGFGV